MQLPSIKKPAKKEKPKVPKKKFSKTNGIELLLAKVNLANVFLRYYRSKRVKSPKTKSKSGRISDLVHPLTSFLALRRNFLKKVLLAGTVIIFLYICLSFIRQYNSIQFSPYLQDPSNQTTTLNYFGPEYNVLISGFKEVSNNHFAEMDLLVSLNSQTGDLKILAINPTYITTTPQFNKKYTLKSLVNNVGSVDPMYQYSKDLESFLGVRIDRYIAFNVDDFQTFLTSWNISMKSIDNFNSSIGAYYNTNSDLTKNALGEYLFTLNSKTTYDTLVSRQLAFFTQFIQNNRSVFIYLKSFWSANDLTNLFHTNMTKDEMSGFLSALMGSNLPAKTALIDSSLGVKDSTDSEDGLSPNYLLFDGKIKNLLLNIDIVKEQANIEIYNAGSVSGLASKMKRIFQNIGMNVISTNNYPEKVSGIKLYVPNKNADSFTNNIAAIEYYFGNDLQVISGNYKYNYTGDLILVLGDQSTTN